MHWAAKYIGIPYEPAARGPDRVDCWGLVCLVYRNEYGMALPLYPGLSLEKPVEASVAIKEGLQDDWVPLDRPVDGALVAMSQREEIHHVALYANTDGGLVIHCWHAQNVVADKVRTLKMRGMRTIKFYQHRTWLTS
jgi:cell wall-associated NlpC family hydrolase